jgi:predicted lipoprotein with Yx(FWY)xxD motif
MSKTFASRALLLVVLAVAGVGTALAVSGPILKGTHNTKLGANIVVSAGGLTLYHLTSEHGAIKCSGKCATFWPPMMWAGKGKPSLGPGLNAAKIGTIKRSNGKLQVTYNKFPLYRYYLDKKPGQATGEGVDDGTGTWYAVSTSGASVKVAAATTTEDRTTGTTTDDNDGTTTSPATTTSGGYTYGPREQ